MDILIIAAAIFGISSLFGRVNSPRQCFESQQPSKTKIRNVYTRDQLMAVNASSVPAPDRFVMRRLVTYDLNREPWPDVPPLPKRKTRRGTAGGRHRPIRGTAR